MNACRILLIYFSLVALTGCFRPTPPPVIPPMIIMLPTATPLPVYPTATPLPDLSKMTQPSDTSLPRRLAQYPSQGFQTHLSFNTLLQSGSWQKYILGPTTKQTAYVVDVTPLEPSVDGAHVEQKILPEYDAESWNDVLWLLLPEQAPPLLVNVHAFQTSDWPVVYQARLQLEPGVWHGYVICEASQSGGYVIEIDPYGIAPHKAAIERATVQPEMPGRHWMDVLRIQSAPEQPVISVDVRAYRTPELPLIADFETVLTPGDWAGTVLQPSSAPAGYVIEITPLDNSGSHIERFVIQPEFNGHTWNDVLRLLVSADRPPMKVHVRVYLVTD